MASPSSSNFSSGQLSSATADLPITADTREQSTELPQRRITPSQKRGHLSIREASDITGLSPSVLRIWEQRYGWPKPDRLDNGYRCYTTRQVEALVVVKTLLEGGRSIADIMYDPKLGIIEGNVPDLRPAKRVVPTYDFSSIAQPTSPDGQRLRAQMEDAVRCGNCGAMARVEAEAMRLRPAERDLAFTAVKQFSLQ